MLYQTTFLLAVITLAAGFASSHIHTRTIQVSPSLLYATLPEPNSLHVVDEEGASKETELPTTKPMKKKPTTKETHKQGIFSPLVYLAKKVLGEEELNRIRANAISIHSDTIKNFVSTADTKFGSQVLATLYKLSDKNKNGKIEMEELELALKAIGFNFLGEKQIKGIFNRAGGEEKGFITLEEWMAEAPKTLKTNLVKLAKTNGGELGFLV